MNKQLLSHPSNINERYRFLSWGFGQFIAHKLNGIYVFVLPNSLEGKLIELIYQRQSMNKEGTIQDPEKEELWWRQYNKITKLINYYSKRLKKLQKWKWDED